MSDALYFERTNAMSDRTQTGVASNGGINGFLSRQQWLRELEQTWEKTFPRRTETTEQSAMPVFRDNLDAPQENCADAPAGISAAGLAVVPDTPAARVLPGCDSCGAESRMIAGSTTVTTGTVEPSGHPSLSFVPTLATLTWGAIPYEPAYGETEPSNTTKVSPEAGSPSITSAGDGSSPFRIHISQSREGLEIVVRTSPALTMDIDALNRRLIAAFNPLESRLKRIVVDGRETFRNLPTEDTPSESSLSAANLDAIY